MSFAERVRQAKEGRKGFRNPEGVYKTKFKDWEFKKSQNGEDMFILRFKFMGVESLTDATLDVDEITEKIREQGKLIEMKLFPKLDFHFDHVLEILSDAGADLSKFDEKDKKFTDIKNKLEELADLAPKCRIRSKHQKEHEKTYVNYRVYEIDKVFDEADGLGSDKLQYETDDGYTYSELLDAGWTPKQIKTKYPNLIEKD
jgi:hypothetical protein